MQKIPLLKIQKKFYFLITNKNQRSLEMNSFETKKQKSHENLKKIFLGLAFICGGGYVCIDYNDFRNANPSCGPKDYADLKFKQLRETQRKVCSFAQQCLTTSEKPN